MVSQKKIPGLFICIFITLKSFSFDLKTHLWIAQQILNDIHHDGKIKVAGNEYPLNENVVTALRNYPEYFRLGTLGPDVFPDPVIGQLTTHPGHPDGWKTDDWLQYVLKKSTAPEEIAFAFGFSCHAAMDIFAHTYVNMYSGDIFAISDGEVAVEARHFALEKYIGLHLPPLVDQNGKVITDYSKLIKAPYKFLSENFILTDELNSQYWKPGVNAVHLSAMNNIYKAVKKTDQLTGDILSKIREIYLDQLAIQAKLATELVSQAGIVKQTEVQLKIAKEGLDIADEGLKVVIRALELENAAIDFSIQQVGNYRILIEEKQRLLSSANDLYTSLQNKINDAEAKVRNATIELLSIDQRICSEVKKKICENAPWPINEVCDIVTDIVCKTNPLYTAAQRELKKLNDLLTGLKEEYASLEAKVRQAPVDIQALTEKIALETASRAAHEANRVRYQANKEILEQSLVVAQESYEAAKKLFDEAKALHDNLKDQLDYIVDVVIKKLEYLAEKYDPIHLMLNNWIGDMENASEAFIKAGEDFAKSNLTGAGNGLSVYRDWFICWKPVFGGVPQEVPQGVCAAKNYYNDLRSQLDAIILDIPVLGDIAKMKKRLEAEVQAKLKPALNTAITQISNRVLGEPFTEFFNLVSQREQVTRSKLVSLFAKDETQKKLVRFTNVATLVDKEMGVRNAAFDIEKFNVIKNALTLSKLVLLPPAQLNALNNNNGGSNGEITSQLYTPVTDETKFNLLLGAVSSIDGSCQWMNISWPYPRQEGLDGDWMNKRRYSYSSCADPNKGFKFWTNMRSRYRVFPVIFKGPLAPELTEYVKFNPSNKLFRACAKNPFPNTSDKNCFPLTADRGCESFFERLFSVF